VFQGAMISFFVILWQGGQALLPKLEGFALVGRSAGLLTSIFCLFYWLFIFLYSSRVADCLGRRKIRYNLIEAPFFRQKFVWQLLRDVTLAGADSGLISSPICFAPPCGSLRTALTL